MIQFISLNLLGAIIRAHEVCGFLLSFATHTWHLVRVIAEPSRAEAFRGTVKPQVFDLCVKAGLAHIRSLSNNENGCLQENVGKSITSSYQGTIKKWTTTRLFHVLVVALIDETDRLIQIFSSELHGR